MTEYTDTLDRLVIQPRAKQGPLDHLDASSSLMICGLKGFHGAGEGELGVVEAD